MFSIASGASSAGASSAADAARKRHLSRQLRDARLNAFNRRMRSAAFGVRERTF